MFFKWIFKAFVAVFIVTNTFNITMAVFDMAQHIVSGAAGVIGGDTNIDVAEALAAMQEGLEDMEIPELLLLVLETSLVSLCMKIMSVLITVILYGRMIEIYLYCSVSPIPFATMTNSCLLYTSLCIGFKNTLLVGNGIALALQLVLMGQSWVKGGNELLGGLSSVSYTHLKTAAMAVTGKQTNRIPFSSSCPLDSIASVSYTHLLLYISSSYITLFFLENSYIFLSKVTNFNSSFRSEEHTSELQSRQYLV